MTAATRAALGGLILALAGGAQTGGARALGTLAGASVQLSGAPVELNAAGQLVVRDGAAVALDGTAAEVRLTRGGTLRLCGPARLGLASGGDGALLLSLGEGAIEMRYAAAVADSLLTPDFRLATIVPPGQLATVSASVSLAANGNLCVLNRGSALELERLADGSRRYVINGQALEFAAQGGEQTVATCPCASAAPGAVAESGGPGELFPSAPALTVSGAASAGAATAASPGLPVAKPARRRFFLSRFWHWLFD